MSDVDTEAPTGVAAPESPLADPAPEAPEKPQEETVTLSKAEVDALRRGQSEAERRAKRLEEQQKKAAEDQAAKQGEWQKLAEQRQAELEQERTERSRVEREARITRLAGRLKFLDPTDVIGRVTAEDGADDASAEAALALIAEQSPHLIAKEATAVPEIGQVLTPSATPDSAPKPPPGKAPLRTIADVEALSDSEFDARYPEVQAVLKTAQ